MLTPLDLNCITSRAWLLNCFFFFSNVANEGNNQAASKTRTTHQLKRQGLLVERGHIGQTGLHLGLDVAFISSCKVDPRDPLERPGKEQPLRRMSDVHICPHQPSPQP